MVAQKIATCCYCGTKAALILRGAPLILGILYPRNLRKR